MRKCREEEEEKDIWEFFKHIYCFYTYRKCPKKIKSINLKKGNTSL